MKMERKAENWYSWIVCISAFLSNSLVFGFFSSYGSIFVAITSEMGVSETVAAWIGSISFGLVFLSASLSSMLCHRYGCRTVMLSGTLLYSVGLISSTFVRHTGLLFLTYSITIGFGGSCIHFSCLLVLRNYFTKRLSLASGIVASGSGIGGLAINPVMGQLLQNYGLQKSLLIYSSSAIFMYITGVIFRESKRPIASDTFTKANSGNRNKSNEEEIVTFKEPRLIYNVAIILLTVSHSLICFGFYIPQVHLIRLALLKGVPYSKATMLPGYIAAAQAAGKIIFGKLSDWPRINRLMACQLCLLVTTVANCLAPISLTYSLLTVYAAFWGFFDGAYNIIIIFLTGDLAGRHRIHAAYGFLSTVSSVFMLLGPPAAGFIHASTGSYTTVFFLSGGNITLAICLMFIIPWCIPKHVTERKELDVKTSHDSDEYDERKEATYDVKRTRFFKDLRDMEECELYTYNSGDSDDIGSIESYYLIPPCKSQSVRAGHSCNYLTTKYKSSSRDIYFDLHQEGTSSKRGHNHTISHCISHKSRSPNDSQSSLNSSVWSVASSFSASDQREALDGSRTTSSDSGIYLSTKKDSLVVTDNTNFWTEVYNQEKDKHTASWLFSASRKPLNVTTLLKQIFKKEVLSMNASGMAPETNSDELQQVVYERVTCL